MKDKGEFTNIKVKYAKIRVIVNVLEGRKVKGRVGVILDKKLRDFSTKKMEKISDGICAVKIVLANIIINVISR